MARRIQGGEFYYSIGSHVLFDKIYYGDSLLVLYHNTDGHKEVFRKLMNYNKGALIYYISQTSNRLGSTSNCIRHTFRSIDGKTLREIKTNLDTHFNEIEGQGGGGLILADWGQGKVGECSLFLPFLEELVQRCRVPLGEGREKRVILVNAFDTSEVDTGFISKAISYHKRIMLMQEHLSIIEISNVSYLSKQLPPKFQVLPQHILESIMKTDLEFVILCVLERENKSGYNILKDLANVFHCILSQGTLYPLLHKLEKQGKIVKNARRGKEIIYSLGPKADADLQLKKEQMLKAFSHFAGFITGSGSPPPEENDKETQIR